MSWEKILSHRFSNCAAHDRLQCDCNARKKSVRSQKIKTQTAIVGVIILQFLGCLRVLNFITVSQYTNDLSKLSIEQSVPSFLTRTVTEMYEEHSSRSCDLKFKNDKKRRI